MLLPEGADRQAFMTGLRDAGVQSSIHYRPIHTFTYYRERYGEISLPITEALAARQVTLPLYPTMGEENFETVVEAVRKL
jgi:dTDP-4-amino-4,6-dideoxygalactose transaminase